MNFPISEVEGNKLHGRPADVETIGYGSAQLNSSSVREGKETQVRKENSP